VKKILALVEGPTEEAFIKHVLSPALPAVVLVPIIIKTSITGAKSEKGGTVTYHKFKRQLQLLLGDTSASVVTTMLDFQGLGFDFPGREKPEGGTSVAKALFVEAAMRKDVNDARYFPYLALHEFEALLFTQPGSIADVLRQPALTKMLQGIRDQYPKTPEEINDSPVTSPSARIESACVELFGSARVFQKRTHGPIIVARIGLEKIRAACPHFNEWVTRLETLAV
jgi:hypothetical protein